MPCKNKPPCGPGYVKYRLASGEMCCRKARSSSRSAVPKKSSASSGAKSGFSLTNAKKMLRQKYSTVINGRISAPPFISTLMGVTGHGSSEKIANLNRTLSTCKKMGVPLVSVNGKKFKSYRTLVSQCGVSFTKTPRGMHASNLVAKFRKNRGSKYNPMADGYEPLPDAPDSMSNSSAPLPDLIDLSDTGDVGQYVPPPLVMFGRRYGFGKKKVRKVSKKRAAAIRKYKKAAKDAGVSMSGDEDLGSYADTAGIVFFGRKRRSTRRTVRRTVRRKSRKVRRKVSKKKLTKKMLKMCRKLKIKTTIKRGSKRVPKKLSVIKKQIKMKMKAMKRRR